MDSSLKDLFYDAYIKKSKQYPELSKLFREFSQFDRVLDLYKDEEFKTGEEILKRVKKDDKSYKHSNIQIKKGQSVYQTPKKHLYNSMRRFKAFTKRKGDTIYEFSKTKDAEKTIRDSSSFKNYSKKLLPSPVLEISESEPELADDEDDMPPKVVEFEKHPPGYNFMGSGTNIWERLKGKPPKNALFKGTEPYGVPINSTDAEALLHDLYYSISDDETIRNYADNVFKKNLKNNGEWDGFVASKLIDLKNIFKGGNEPDNKVIMSNLGKKAKLKIKLVNATYKTYMNLLISRGYKEEDRVYKKFKEIENPELETSSTELLDMLLKGFDEIDDETTYEKIEEYEKKLDDINNGLALDPRDTIEEIKKETPSEIEETKEEIKTFEDMPENPPELEREDAVQPRRRIFPVEDVKEEVKEEVKVESKLESKVDKVENKELLTKIDIKMPFAAKVPVIGTEDIKTKKETKKESLQTLEKEFIYQEEPYTSLKELERREYLQNYKKANLYADRYNYLETGMKGFKQSVKNKILVRFSERQRIKL